MAKPLGIIFSLFFLWNSAKGQIAFGVDSLMLKKFDFEDKQISEFFDRFNFKEPVKFTGNIASMRTRNIISLINLKDSALFHNRETSDFIKYVSNDSNKVYLDYGDKNWFAIAHCSFRYRDKNCLIDVILKTEGNQQDGYKWVMCEVKGDIFPRPALKSEKAAFIDPMNHEVGFTELSNALNKQSASLFQYTEKTYRPDYLTAFLMMVKSGSLKFMQITTIDFQFLQVPGWMFTVVNFNRKEYNSGWLISSLKRMDDNEKAKYIRAHFLNI